LVSSSRCFYNCLEAGFSGYLGYEFGFWSKDGERHEGGCLFHLRVITGTPIQELKIKMKELTTQISGRGKRQSEIRAAFIPRPLDLFQMLLTFMFILWKQSVSR
jgi:hypothetical protein